MIYRLVTLLAVFLLQTSPFISISQADTAPTIQLPASGQTKCYDLAGAEITCAGTNLGQDGALRTGVPWDESTRFNIDGNGPGTVIDTLTGLTWLRNANCTETLGGVTKSDGTTTWSNSLLWSAGLSSGKCGLLEGSVAGTWRLPTRKELESLLSRGEADNAAWLNGKGFQFQTALANGYWTSSTNANVDTNAWQVHMDTGEVDSLAKTGLSRVLAVRVAQ